MDQKKVGTVPYHVRLHRSTADRLAQLAALEGESQATIVRRLLREGLSHRFQKADDGSVKQQDALTKVTTT